MFGLFLGVEYLIRDTGYIPRCFVFLGCFSFRFWLWFVLLLSVVVVAVVATTVVGDKFMALCPCLLTPPFMKISACVDIKVEFNVPAVI